MPDIYKMCLMFKSQAQYVTMALYNLKTRAKDSTD